ncbi:MAG: hypothetical protein MJY79_00175 [Bacteroidaceae bacterium]|nr:hypothetical protein [Bacteroidaceae bacterium]
MEHFGTFWGQVIAWRGTGPVLARLSGAFGLVLPLVLGISSFPGANSISLPLRCPFRGLSGAFGGVLPLVLGISSFPGANSIFLHLRDHFPLLAATIPSAVMSVIRLSGGFGGDGILFLNKVLDLREERTIEPHKTYRETFIIPVTAPVFRKGVNYFKLYYLSRELGGKMKVYNKLTGSLESDEFLIYVN